MKRCWMGFFLLVFLIGAGLTVSWAMAKLHDPMEQDLNRAAQSALAGDWEEAARLSERAKKTWEDWTHFRACFADHTPVEEIDAALAALEIYETARDEGAFAAQSASLARKIAAVGEAHGLVWWNFF